MYIRNDNSNDDHVLQNQFTAYLVTAIRRRKSKYLTDKEKLRNEISFDCADSFSTLQTDIDLTSGLPVIDQIGDAKLKRALGHVSDQNLHIFLSRVIKEKPLTEIAEELGLNYQTVATNYRRSLEKLRKELTNNE